MPCKKETRTIDDLECFVVQMPAMQALKMKFRIAKIIGKSVMEIIQALKTKTISTGQTASAFESLFSSCDPDALSELIFDIIATSKIDGKRVGVAEFDDIFTGHFLTMYKVMMFVLEVNYKDLFGSQQLGALLAKTEGLKQTSQSGPESTPGSTNP